jgi:hypothetical protein
MCVCVYLKVFKVMNRELLIFTASVNTPIFKIVFYILLFLFTFKLVDAFYFLII